MSHGGYRPGAGRPSGTLAAHTLQAQSFQKRLIERVLEEQEPIINALIQKAKEGQTGALKEVFERVLGRVQVPLEIEYYEPEPALTDEQKEKLLALLGKSG